MTHDPALASVPAVEVRSGMEVLPIACTLTAQELARDAGCLMPGLLHRTSAITQVSNGVMLEFERADGVLRDVADVVERERKCCRFLQFVLTVPPGDGPFVLEVTGPEGTSQFLAELISTNACRPQTPASWVSGRRVPGTDSLP